jgi:hypothetical protein
MSEPQTSKTKRNGRFKKLLLILAAILGLTVAGGWAWYCYTFPYGFNHCCSKQLGMSLKIFASDNNGWYPLGGKTPEASLSLVCTNDPTMLYVVRGKSVSLKAAQQTWDRDGVLNPEACGWHYIEGLREGDDPEIAVAWDKVTGLGHDGERRKNLAHEVVFLDASTHFIPKTGWTQFVAEQKQKLEEVMASRQSNAPPIRWSDEATLGVNRFPASRH